MFKKNKIDLTMIDPTSKIALKLSCLESCKGDVDKAKKLYEFMAEGANIPDFPTPKPTFMQQAQDVANGIFGWFDQNGDKIMKGVNFVQSLRGGASPVPASAEAIPPLPPVE